MLTVNEAVDRMAAGILARHAAELVQVYRAFPTRAGNPRKAICAMVSHAIQINEAIRYSRAVGNYPLAIENMPALIRVERKVFRAMTERSREQG